MSISEVARRAIIDELTVRAVRWAGRLEEPDFLTRLYDLTALPSTDGRFRTAAADIRQHRVNNDDWDDDWVFHDPRFELLRGGDELFLRFLAETVHPVVRRDADAAEELVDVYNEHLRHDGYELAAVVEISGRPVFAGRKRLAVAGVIRRVEQSVPVADADYLVVAEGGR